MSPASVDYPEPRLVYCFVDVEEALVLQNAQRDKAERRDSEVGPVSDLFSEPMLHTVDRNRPVDRPYGAWSPKRDRKPGARHCHAPELCASARPDEDEPLHRSERLHIDAQVFS